MELKFHKQLDKRCIYIMSENITLLCITILKVLIICYTLLFFWDTRYFNEMGLHWIIGLEFDLIGSDWIGRVPLNIEGLSLYEQLGQARLF